MTVGETRHDLMFTTSERYIKPTSSPMHADVRDPGARPNASFLVSVARNEATGRNSLETPVYT